LKHAEARFSDEAIHAKQGGSCIISFLVDEHGMPQDFLVVQGLGYGLTEKALEAVRQYRFKPAMKDGQPVRTTLSVAIDFHLY
jgi:TonB family protein